MSGADDSQPVPDLPPTATTTTNFVFEPVSEEEVCNAILKVRSDAIGLDNIPLSFIKMLLPVIGAVVTRICNQSMMQ